MSKVMIIPSSMNMIKNTLTMVDAYCVSLQDYSIHSAWQVSLKEIKQIKKTIKEKDLFIALDRNLFNKDIKPLKKILHELEKIQPTAILFYDIAIFHLVKKENLHLSLVWNQEHMTTNYHTINYWYDKGATYTRVSSEITLKEILEIKKETKSKLIVPMLGYLPMFVSKRKLITNYKKTFSLKDDSKLYFLVDGQDKYPIIEDQYGTYVYSSSILNGIPYKKIVEENQIDYLLLNSFLIPSFETVLSAFLQNKTETLRQLLQNQDTAFFEKNTIYKVK